MTEVIALCHYWESIKVDYVYTLKTMYIDIYRKSPGSPLTVVK